MEEGEEAVSCDWHVHCRTCDSSHEYDENHAKETCEALIKHGASLAAAIEHDVGALVVRVEDEYGRGIYGLKWFEEHKGHDLVPKDEYGTYADFCRQYYDARVTDGQGGWIAFGRRHCELLLNHAEPCGPKT